MFSFVKSHHVVIISFIFLLLVCGLFFILNKKQFRCSDPKITYVTHGKNHNSACLIIEDEKFLTVLNKSTKAWDFPGGTAIKNEKPHCVAQRETLEEIGIHVSPIKKIHEYNNGFSLFLCELEQNTYQENYTVPVFAMLEIKAIKWQTLEAINKSSWRFPKYWPETKMVIETNIKNKPK